VLLKLYCNLRVVPIAFAAKDGPFAVFRVAYARALAQAGLAGGLGVKPGAWGRAIFCPRAAKKLAMLSMELPADAGRETGREPGAMRVVENLVAGGGGRLPEADALVLVFVAVVACFA
jgi:hypothetical protein